MQNDIVEIKSGLRDIRGDIQELRKEVHGAKIWALVLYAALAAALLGAMARGFHWI